MFVVCWKMLFILFDVCCLLACLLAWLFVCLFVVLFVCLFVLLLLRLEVFDQVFGKMCRKDMGNHGKTTQAVRGPGAFQAKADKMNPQCWK